MTKGKMTRIIMGINVLVFILMTVSGGSQNTGTLLKFNAMNKALVFQGEWWRMFCAIFIHIGFFHLLMNMYFLNNVGGTFEMLFGSRNFLIIYILTGLMGNLLSYAFGDLNTVSAGASVAGASVAGASVAGACTTTVLLPQPASREIASRQTVRMEIVLFIFSSYRIFVYLLISAGREMEAFGSTRRTPAQAAPVSRPVKMATIRR